MVETEGITRTGAALAATGSAIAFRFFPRFPRRRRGWRFFWGAASPVSSVASGASGGMARRSRWRALVRQRWMNGLRAGLSRGAVVRLIWLRCLALLPTVRELGLGT